MKKQLLFLVSFICFLLFLAFSWVNNLTIGQKIGLNFWLFFQSMMLVLPAIFILIGLFEVWVSKKTIENHMGQDSSFLAYFWSILLAGFSVGGIFVSFPIAYALFKKGAKLSVIFFYIGASGISRIPMTLYEASFVGLKFTIIRLAISLPLLLAMSIMLGSYLEKRGYRIETK